MSFKTVNGSSFVIYAFNLTDSVPVNVGAPYLSSPLIILKYPVKEVTVLFPVFNIYYLEYSM